MGYIVDHSNPKRGKMKTYLLYTPIPVAILTFFLFFAPNISDSQKMIYAGITYVAWGMIYTSSDVPFWSLPNVLTPNADERGSIISKARTFNGVGSAIPMALFMILGFVLPKFNLSGTELEKTKYTVMVLICSIIGNILFVRVYFKSKERVNIPIPPKKDKNTPNSLKLIFTCKPLMLTALMGILSAARYMFQAGAVHVARYSFYIGKDPATLSGTELEQALQSNISTVSTVLAGASAIGMFGAMIAVTPLIKKFSYKQIIIASSLLGSASSFAMWFIGYDNFWACVPCLLISTIPCGTINVCAFAMVGDCLDYMELKTGVRLTGMGSAIQSFVTKFGNAIATSAIILMYIVVGLDVSSINASVTANPLEMDTSIRQGIFSIISLIPAISLLLCIIPMLFYNLTGEYKEKMEADLAKQRAERGIEIK
jgi:Na+/melibiose symporter-like transporter